MTVTRNGAKGGVYIQRIGGVPRSITVQVRRPIEKYITLPMGCSEDEAERIRKACADSLAAGTFDAGATIADRIRDRDSSEVPPESVDVANEPTCRLPRGANRGSARHINKTGLMSLPESPGVYFIQVQSGGESGPIKIGISSTNVQWRVRMIACGFPWPLKVLGWTSGGPQEERLAQHVMRKHRMNGEWFRNDEVVSEFVSRCVAVGVKGASKERNWFKLGSAVVPKEQKPYFDMKAYISWLNGETEDCPPIQLAAREPQRPGVCNYRPSR